MADNEKRLLKLLILVGYSVAFPVYLAQRIGGHPEYNRHVVYQAIRENYVKLQKWHENLYVIKSLQLTQKGYDYIAQRDSGALAMIYGRLGSMPPLYPSMHDRIIRLHSIAAGMIIAMNTGAVVPPEEKPSLLVSPGGYPGEITPDPDTAYYYTSQEIRAALEEADERTVAKTSRLIGIIVRGHRLYCLYYAGRTRMFWLRFTEENNANAAQTFLNSRGFQVSTVFQVVIGHSMDVAEKLCRKTHPFGDRYYTVSPYFDKCYFITDDPDGEKLLRLIIDPVQALEFNRKVLTPYAPPMANTREYDAVEVSSNRPVILNYTCDLLQLSNTGPSMIGFDGGPIVLCFDYQARTIQHILGAEMEVRIIPQEVDL